MSDRKTLLASFLALGCLILYVRYARGAGWKWLVAPVALYLLALMSKPTATPLPLLLLDYWAIRRLSRGMLIDKVPFSLIGALGALVTFVSQSRSAAVTLPGEHPPTQPDTEG